MKTLTDKDIDTLCEYLQGLKGRGIRVATSSKSDTYQIDHGSYLETKLLAQRVVLEIDIPPEPPVVDSMDLGKPAGPQWRAIACRDQCVSFEAPELGASRACPECGGTGKYHGLIAVEPCQKCSGTGKDCT